MRRSSNRLARDPEYAYVDVVGRPSYADVMRVVEGDRRLAPDGYRVVVDRRRAEADGAAESMAVSILKLASEIQEICKMCTANQAAIEQLREEVKKLKEQPPEPQPKYYPPPPEPQPQYYQPPPEPQPQYYQPQAQPQPQPQQYYQQDPQQYYPSAPQEPNNYAPVYY
jgi:hypothetical protein